MSYYRSRIANVPASKHVSSTIMSAPIVNSSEGASATFIDLGLSTDNVRGYIDKVSTMVRAPYMNAAVLVSVYVFMAEMGISSIDDYWRVFSTDGDRSAVINTMNKYIEKIMDIKKRDTVYTEEEMAMVKISFYQEFIRYIFAMLDHQSYLNKNFQMEEYQVKDTRVDTASYTDLAVDDEDKEYDDVDEYESEDDNDYSSDYSDYSDEY